MSTKYLSKNIGRHVAVKTRFSGSHQGVLEVLTEAGYCRLRQLRKRWLWERLAPRRSGSSTKKRSSLSVSHIDLYGVLEVRRAVAATVTDPWWRRPILAAVFMTFLVTLAALQPAATWLHALPA